MRAPLFTVACLTVNIPVRTVAGDDRVERFGAVLTFEAFTMPWTTFGENLFGGEDHTTATGTSLTGRCLYAGRIDDGGPGSCIATFTQSKVSDRF